MLKTTFSNNDNVTPTVAMCSVHLHWLHWAESGDVHKILLKGEVLKLVPISLSLSSKSG